MSSRKSCNSKPASTVFTKCNFNIDSYYCMNCCSISVYCYVPNETRRMLCSFGLPPSYTSTFLNDIQIVLIKWDLTTPPPSVGNRINVSILFSILLESTVPSPFMCYFKNLVWIKRMDVFTNY